jgi:signal transduction histidine kinase
MSILAGGGQCAAQSRTTNPARKQTRSDLHEQGTLGAIAMSIVHDLRNPLSAIHGAAEILNDLPASNEVVVRLSRSIYDASLQIKQLLQDYVDRCLSAEAENQLSSLHALVSAAVNRIVAASAETCMLIQVHVPDNLYVRVDRIRISSVLSNLLTNAVQAMTGGGVISICAAGHGDSVVVKVRDTGPGIPPEIHDRLFHPFVTARKPGGWGLGLAQARQIVLEHGGEMWLESHPAEGACFAFSLPRG